MEHLLHYVWQHMLDRSQTMTTTDGRPLRVIDPGLHNTDAGPDFFNAKIEIDGTMWAGNVELHQRSSDWYAHGHDRDSAYDSVVLHVCSVADRTITRHGGGEVPQLLLQVPDDVRRNYESLQRAAQSPACAAVTAQMPAIVTRSWLASLAVERMRDKTGAVNARLARMGGNWEDAFFVALARNFGFGINGDTFERWATALPYRAMDKHRDGLHQVESIMFGTSGLLDDGGKDPYETALRDEYAYLRHKFSLPAAPPLAWQMMRTRPANFPHVRIAQLAHLYHTTPSLFSRMMEAGTDGLRHMLAGGTSDYWHTHYTFSRTSPYTRRTVTAKSAALIAINTIAPHLYAYGLYKGDTALCDKAQELLESLPAEDNHVTRLWRQAGITPESAADTQALMQLTREYCEKKKCIYCRFGYEYLKCKRIL